MATGSVNMGPFGNDEEVVRLIKYGLEYDRQRLIAAGAAVPQDRDPSGATAD